jgi:small-conductance mechanosensitive channel
MDCKAALAVIAIVVPLLAQEPVAISRSQVISQLESSAFWYQHLMALDEGSATAENLLPRDNAREFAKRAMQSSFAFARAQAAVLSNTAEASADPNNPAISTLQQSLNKASTRVSHLEERLQGLDSRIERANGPQREALVDERAAIAADLALAKQVETAVKTMTSFTAPRTGGKKGLLDEIAKWEALNPVSDVATEKDKAPTVRAPRESTVFHPESAGIVVLAARAINLNGVRSRIDAVRGETENLLDKVNTLRGPLRGAVRAIVAESDTISASEDNAAQPSEWLNTSKQISGLSVRFKQLASVAIPLGETAMSLQSVHGALDEWHKQLDSSYNSTVRYLAIRLAILLGGVLFILLASAIWQRAIFRYVTEPRRRRQLLLIQRVVVGVALAILLTLGFLSSLGSVATLLGFVTAGLALALQNVILSAVAYFFLIGRYGLRVGDRVTVQGVTGEVIEVGLIRLFLMELVGTGTDLHPTGRLAVFANSVIFQPAALMKQAPGMDYAWHAVTMTVEDRKDYQQTRTRLTKAVSAVYEEYRVAIDQQHKAFEQTTHVAATPPSPTSYAQLSENGLELTIRYPVSLNEHPGHIDERMMDCLIAEADIEPKLKFAAGGSPKISQVV